MNVFNPSGHRKATTCAHCKSGIEVPVEVWEQALRWSRLLVKRGEPPLDGAGLCEPCYAKHQATLKADHARQYARRVAVYRDYKAGQYGPVGDQNTHRQLPGWFWADTSLADLVHRYDAWVQTEAGRRSLADRRGGGKKVF